MVVGSKFRFAKGSGKVISLYHRIKLIGPRPRMFAESARPRLARTARLAAQRPDRDVGAHFEGVEALALWVVVDARVLPAIA